MFGPRETRTTIGIPGAGLSMSETARSSLRWARLALSFTVWVPFFVAGVLGGLLRRRRFQSLRTPVDCT
jgi:hypothetical protein